MIVSFHVLGVPAPQGSKSAVVRGGHAVVIEGASKGQRDRHRNWRSAVAEAARDALSTHGLTAALDGPLHLTVTFRHPMPASRPKRIREHGTAWKTSAPDASKLLRATEDGLQAGGLIADDARLAEIVVRKVETVGWTGAEIHIETIEDQP